MNIYTRKQRWKKLLLGMALLIGIGSLWYTNRLVGKLQIEEKKKVEIWAKATERFSSPTAEFDKLQFEFDIIKDNNTVPVILATEKEIGRAHV